MIQYGQGEGLFDAFYSVFLVQLGSAVFSAHVLCHAVVATCITVAIDWLTSPEVLNRVLDHPSVYFSGFSSCLGFLLVYRANLAYQRYWEARGQIETMASKLRQVGIQSCTFVQTNDDTARSWKSCQLRRLALYHALALMELRHARLNLQKLRDEGLVTDAEVAVLSGACARITKRKGGSFATCSSRVRMAAPCEKPNAPSNGPICSAYAATRSMAACTACSLALRSLVSGTHAKKGGSKSAATPSPAAAFSPPSMYVTSKKVSSPRLRTCSLLTYGVRERTSE